MASEEYVNTAVTALRADFDGIVANVNKDSARQKYDISKSLGLHREQKAYQTRLDALTDPTS